MVQNEGEKAERLAPSPTAAIGREWALGLVGLTFLTLYLLP